MSIDYLAAVHDRVVILGGATGTNLQAIGLTPDDFGGPGLEGCNEVLNVTRPDVVEALHASFLEVGCDVVETNTFGGFAVPLGEYGIGEQAFELSRAGAEIARRVAADFSSPDHPRWVAGSIGPGTKMPSLGHIRYAALRDSYEVMAAGLLAGGIDLFLVETQYDLLGLKAAVNGCKRAMAAAGRRVPIQAQVTIESTGRMLPGTEIGAALTAIEPLLIDVIGINCATGPEEMREHVRHLARYSRRPVAVVPNAGLPRVEGGRTVYDLAPETLADHHARFVEELGVSVIGGCCGTTPEHLEAVVARCRSLEPARRHPRHVPAAASTYTPVPFRQDTSFLIIGERTNATGSRQFREAMVAEDWDACVGVARDQVSESAHLIDLCVDFVGRDGRADMDALASRLATGVTVPLVLDSAEPEVMEAGLEWIGGRAVLNSANLEDGDTAGSRADRVFLLAAEHGAAVVCLLIDERGQARDVARKMEIAHRLHDLAVGRHGLEPADLFFDPLTFPLATGDDDLRGDAAATLEALRRIKAELPGTFTVLGVSNVSFGLKPATRRVLNSVFLHECLDAGLDAAIVHAGRILPLSHISEEHRTTCLDLIHDRRSPEYDPLQRLLELGEGPSPAVGPTEDRSAWPVQRRLARRIVDGDRDGLGTDLDDALQSMPALDIVNGVLLDGMRTVGDLFSSGDMQLPFVLQSAETMKAAVRHLEPHMDHAEGETRGRIVLATVRGDVHDIGKNLVDIILTNNGYEVHNLGTKVGLVEMIDKALEVDADAIGMSGLLAKSALVMRDNLEEMERGELSHLPVLLGGAALTRTYVENDLRETYPGPLFYGKDAFTGLRVMDRIAEMRRTGTEDPDFGRAPEGSPRPPRGALSTGAAGPVSARAPGVDTDNPIFRPPFLGSRVVSDLPVDEIAEYLNETALFRHQWQFRPAPDEDDHAFKERLRPLLRERLGEAAVTGLLRPRVAYGYFPANGDGDDLILWEDEARSREQIRFHFPRQQQEPWLCIADFFRSADSGEVDFVAFHVVTMGGRVSEVATGLFADDRYRDYLLTHGLGVGMTEALAEYWHFRIREEWGFAGEDDPTLHDLFRQRYRGGRYSWGYPACPDLEDNARVAKLLGTDRIGVACSATTAWQYRPEQTTSALICHHPGAKYFVAGGPRRR